MALALEALGLRPGERIGLSIRLLREAVEVERLPRYGELELQVPGRDFEVRHWQV